MKNTRKYYQINFGDRGEKEFVKEFSNETESRFSRKLKKVTKPDSFPAPYHQELIELDHCYTVWSKPNQIFISIFPNQGTDSRRFVDEVGEAWLACVNLGRDWSNPDESIKIAESLLLSLDPECHLIKEEDPNEVIVTPRSS